MVLSKDEKEKRKQERSEKKHRETHKFIDGIDHKICSICDEWKPSDTENFYANKSNNIDGLHPWCKECTVTKSSGWIKNNRDKHREALKVQNKKPKNKQRKRFLEKIRRESGAYRKWQIDNSDKLMLSRKKRQNKVHNISNIEWENCKNYFNYRCAYCGLALENHWVKYKGEIRLGDFHKDHVNHEGANDLSNCVPACKSCNCKKHDKLLGDWYKPNNELYCDVYSGERLLKIHKWLEEDFNLYIKTKIK